MWGTREPDRFVIGANLPWVGYGTDIGTSAWFPDGGLARQPAALDTLERAFARLAQDGIRIARVFVLCDARSGVVFDGAGSPLGLDGAALADFDALLGAARRYGLGLIPVLLDFHLCGPLEMVDGVQLGGRSKLIADPASRAAFIDRVLRPIIERGAGDDAVIAWDVINEPEWCLSGGLFSRTTVRFGALQRFLGDAVQCIRRLAPQPITIGCAGTWQLDLVRPLGLDFYQIHWYEKFGWPALDRPVADLGLHDRPAILGEFSGRGSRITEVLDTAKRAGYEGALVWSVLSDDEYSAYPADLADWVRTR